MPRSDVTTGVEQEQQDVGAVVVEEQVPVAGAVAPGADVVEPFEQRHQPVEVLQPDDVAVAQRAGSTCRHATRNAQMPCRA